MRDTPKLDFNRNAGQCPFDECFARNRASGYNSTQGDARSSQPPHLQAGFPVHGSLNNNFAPLVGSHASNLKIWMSKNL